MATPLPKRKHVRLRQAEYSDGAFLVTIVSWDRQHRFGQVIGRDVIHSPLGRLADRCWAEAVRGRENMRSLEHVVMPNHVHAVVEIWQLRSIEREEPGLIADGLSGLVGGYKAGVTRRARASGLLEPGDQLWQRGFHDAILRTDRSIADACEYVRRNPELWGHDPLA